MFPFGHRFLSTIEEGAYERALNEAAAKAVKACTYGGAYGAGEDHAYEVHSDIPFPTYSTYAREGTRAVFRCEFRKSTGRILLLGIDFTGHARSRGNRERTALADYASRTMLHAQQDPRVQNSRERGPENGAMAFHSGPERVRRVRFASEQQREGAVCVPEPIQSLLPFDRGFREVTGNAGLHHHTFRMQVLRKLDETD